MRHRKAGLKLNRTTSHRNAMFRNMVTSLFKYDRIKTTGTKAMELRRWADHLITLAKRGDLHARRQALAIVREKDVVHKLFENAAERFGAVSGGYTRVVKLGTRPGDAAPVALVELVISEATPKKKAKKKKTKAEAAPPKASGEKKALKKEEDKPKKATKAKATSADKTEESAVKAPKTTGKKAKAPAKKEAETKAKPAAKAAPKKKVAAKKEDKVKVAEETDKKETPEKEK